MTKLTTLQRDRGRATAIPTVAALAALATAGAGAQSILEEIVVTAQKREQSIQDVGISITSLDGDQIRALGLTSTSDIISQAPSVHMLSFSPSLTVFNIRGVSQNDFADHFEGPVAVFVDEAYVSAQGAVDSQMFDVERVEVLRGPQGTLFGRNATGGIIHYISRKPTENFEGYGELTFAEYNQVKFEGAVSGPLSERLLGRLSFATNHHDGWVENQIGADLNEVEDYSYRAQLLFKATEDLEILANVHGVSNDDTAAGYQHNTLFVNADGLGEDVPENVNFYGTCPGCDPWGYVDTDGDPWLVRHDRLGFFERDVVGITGTITWTPGALTVTSITDYLTMDKTFQSDTDASPNDVARYNTDQNFDQVSQELRVAGGSDRLRWVTGFYYLDIDSEQTAIGGFSIPGVFDFNSEPAWTVTTESWALFGQVDYDLAANWTIIGGLRYSEDTKEMDYRRTDNFGAVDVFNTTTSPTAKQSFENVSAKVELDWKPTDDLLVYVSFNRGHKGGSFAAPLFPPVLAAELPHDEEVLHAYEGGFKSTFLGGKARLNAAVFYYDYSDYQAFSFANLTQAITNVDATVKGVEVELQANPLEGLDLSLGFSSLDGEAENVRLPTGRLADREMPMTPDIGLNGLARYAWPAFGGRLALQFDFEYSDEFYYYVLNPPQSLEGDYFLGNARVSYTTADERWQAALFVKNVTETEYRVYTNDISSLGFANNHYGAPRWIGGTVSYRWD